MSFSEAVRSVYRQYATFSGRASRSEYWYFQLFLFVVLFGVYAVGLIVYAISQSAGAFGIAMIVALPFGLVSVIPNLAVTVRRLHDTGRSGWWLLVGLIPYLGSIIVLILLVLAGTPGPNRFGPQPGRPGTQHRVQYTGWTPDDAMRAFAEDAQRAALMGYQPQWQEWLPPRGGVHVLEVSYGLAPAPQPWSWAPPPPPSA